MHANMYLELSKYMHLKHNKDQNMHLKNVIFSWKRGTFSWTEKSNYQQDSQKHNGCAVLFMLLKFLSVDNLKNLINTWMLNFV